MPNKKKTTVIIKQQPKPQRQRRKVRQRATTIVVPKEAMSAGARVGSKVGEFLGDAAQQVFKRITGFGDYTINGNTLLGGSPPMFTGSGGRRSTIIRHREFISDVYSSTAFNITSYPINPGMTPAFPWLSTLAENFEEYWIHGLVFEFKTTSGMGVGTTNLALGTVIMASQYNSLAPNFSSKLQMENYEFSTSCAPSNSCLHPIECKPDITPVCRLYVRSSAPPANADLRLYDLANFQLATVGMQAAGFIVGELWCTYEIELIKPKLNTTLSGPLYAFVRSNSPTASVPVQASSAVIGGTLVGVTVPLNNQIGIADQRLAGRVCVITYTQFGSAGATYICPSISYTGATSLSLFNNSTSPLIQTVQATDTKTTITRAFTVGPAGSFTINFATDGTGVGVGVYSELWLYVLY